MLSEDTISPVSRDEAPPAHPDRPRDPARRRVLTGAAAAILGAVGALLAVPLTGMLLSPVLRRTRSVPVPIGPVERFQGPDPVPADYTFRQRQAWLEREVTRGVYVVTSAGGIPTVLSVNCTHLGCRVQWDAAAQQFRCPCHGGCFDREGRRVAGPPPRPLARLASSVRDGILYVEEPAEV